MTTKETKKCPNCGNVMDYDEDVQRTCQRNRWTGKCVQGYWVCDGCPRIIGENRPFEKWDEKKKRWVIKEYQEVSK